MNHDIDKNAFKAIFEDYSPSSREYRFQYHMKRLFETLGYKGQVDACGNFFTDPLSDKPIILIVAHADHVALQVKEITSEGFLKFRKIGGIDIHSFYGQEVRVIHKESQIPGIIGRDPRNVSESESGYTINTKSLWVDIGATSEEEARKYVDINDMIVFCYSSVSLLNHIIASPACDDKTGVYCVYKLAEAFAGIRKSMPFDLCFALSSQEEIGCRGSKALALRLKPYVAIMLDTEYANDFPGGNTDIELGAGPVLTDNADNNPALVSLARSIDTVHQYAFTSEFYGCTDAESFITHSPNTAVLGIGIPVRNMHSAKEAFSITDLNLTIKFIVNLINKLSHQYEEGGMLSEY